MDNYVKFREPFWTGGAQAVLAGRLVELMQWSAIAQWKPIELSHLFLLAVAANQPAIVDYLVGQGADVGYKDPKGDTGLHIAISLGFDGIAKMLLKSPKTVINETNAIGWAPIHYAALNGNRDLYHALCSLGADDTVTALVQGRCSKDAVSILFERNRKSMVVMQQPIEHLKNTLAHKKAYALKSTADRQKLLQSLIESQKEYSDDPLAKQMAFYQLLQEANALHYYDVLQAQAQRHRLKRQLQFCMASGCLVDSDALSLAIKSGAGIVGELLTYVESPGEALAQLDEQETGYSVLDRLVADLPHRLIAGMTVTTYLGYIETIAQLLTYGAQFKKNDFSRVASEVIEQIFERMPSPEREEVWGEMFLNPTLMQVPCYDRNQYITPPRTDSAKGISPVEEEDTTMRLQF